MNALMRACFVLQSRGMKHRNSARMAILFDGYLLNLN